MFVEKKLFIPGGRRWLVPAYIAGRDASSLLSIYVGQITSGGRGAPGPFNDGAPRPFHGDTPGPFNGSAPGPLNGREALGPFNGGVFDGSGVSSSSLTLNAPSFYQWLPANAPAYWKWVGILLAAAVVVLVGVLLLASKQLLTSALLLTIALVFALSIPFFLPEMHERYFYLADVISLLSAFYFPRTLFIAVMMQVCSLLSYAPYLMHTQVINFAYVAVAVLVMIVITSIDLVMKLYPHISFLQRTASMEKNVCFNREHMSD